MLSVASIEQIPISIILREVINLKDFVFDVNDSDDLLRLKYIYFNYERITSDDKQFIDNFGEFSRYWLTPKKELYQLFEEEGLYLDDTITKINLIKTLILVVEQNNTVLPYFKNISPELFCSLLAWIGMNKTIVVQLYNNCNERNEELILTLETYGFEFVSLPKLLPDILDRTYYFCDKKSQKSLRCVCKRYCDNPLTEYVPPPLAIYDEIYKGTEPLDRIHYNSFYKPKPEKHSTKVFGVGLNIYRAVLGEDLTILWNERKTITCTANLLLLLRDACDKNKYASINTLLMGYVDVYNKGSDNFKKNQRNTLIKLRVFVKVNIPDDYRDALLALLTV